MEFFKVAVEGHRHSRTIYVVGMLSERAALQMAQVIRESPPTTLVLRVELRGVCLIDPSSFVGVARALAVWRDRTCGRVLIEFPESSMRRARPTAQPKTIGSAVSTAMSWPMSTSPG